MSPIQLLDIDCQWSEERCNEALETLPVAVQERANRYLVSGPKRNLIVSQYTLRTVLRKLGLNENNLKICPNGRPYLEGSPFEFNLSHSSERAVLILSWNLELERALGVDVEWVHREVERDALAKRFFTPEECEFATGDAWNFFHIWTRKEAVLKSNGIGLRVALDSFTVLPNELPSDLTGRGLNLYTHRLKGDYLASWAVGNLAEKPTVKHIEAWQPGWLDTLAEGIKA